MSGKNCHRIVLRSLQSCPINVDLFFVVMCACQECLVRLRDIERGSLMCSTLVSILPPCYSFG